MKDNIIKLQEIKKNRQFLGGKTLNLKKLVDWGFNVPSFIAIPSNISSKLYSNDNFKKIIIEEVINALPCKKYAIRSSALVEDNKNKSFAGQFLTKLNLSKKELLGGLSEVLSHGKNILNDDLNKFSIIIQEYIEPDASGITFTRSPQGNLEIIIEYSFCEGEKILG
jgi:pyruvate,water dikinase